jgi:hydroxymethylpyrimidine pyrophosphatase-like HAD family hydrolase
LNDSAAVKSSLPRLVLSDLDGTLVTHEKVLTKGSITDAASPHVAKEQGTVKFAPVVTGDFEAHLRQAATFVTASCDDEGFAKAMEQFVLPLA